MDFQYIYVLLTFHGLQYFLQDWRFQIYNLIFNLIKHITFLNGVSRVLEPHSSYIDLSQVHEFPWMSVCETHRKREGREGQRLWCSSTKIWIVLSLVNILLLIMLKTETTAASKLYCKEWNNFPLSAKACQ